MEAAQSEASSRAIRLHTAMRKSSRFPKEHPVQNILLYLCVYNIYVRSPRRGSPSLNSSASS